MMTDKYIYCGQDRGPMVQVFTTLVVHNTQGMVVPCIAAYICCFLEQCMSRPYPVGEAGHKLASLYNYYACWLYKSRLYRLCTGKLGTAANACAFQDGLSKDPRRRVGL